MKKEKIEELKKLEKEFIINGKEGWLVEMDKLQATLDIITKKCREVELEFKEVKGKYQKSLWIIQDLIGENKKTSKDINRYEKKIKYLEKEVSVKESVNEHIRRIYKRDLNKELKTEGKE